MSKKLIDLFRFANKYKQYLFLVFIFVFFLLVNLKTPMIGEDFGLSPINASVREFPLVSRFALITQKISTHYIEWNSRLGEQIAIFFLGFDKFVFDICNSLLTTGLIVLIFVYAFGRMVSPNHPDDFLALLLVFSLYICFLPRLGEVTFWLAGSANYLWGVTILLAFFLPYRLTMFSRKVKDINLIPTILFTLFGFAAGLTNENTVPVFLFLLILLLVVFKKRNVQLPPWFFLGSVSLLMGYVALMLSASTRRRLRFYAELFGVENPGWSDYLFRINIIITRLLESVGPLILVFILAGTALLVSRYLDNKKQNNQLLRNTDDSEGTDLKAVLTILISSLISALILIGNSYFEIRAFLLIEFMLMASTVACIFNKRFLKKYRYQITILVRILLIPTVWFMLDIFQQYSTFFQDAQARHEYILELKAEGKDEILVNAYQAEDTRFLTTREIWLMNSIQYELFYGVDSIEIIQP